MYITGPDVVKAVTGEQVTHEELGGADPHSTKSGVAHFVSNSEADCLDDVRRLLGFLPSNNLASILNSEIKTIMFSLTLLVSFFGLFV